MSGVLRAADIVVTVINIRISLSDGIKGKERVGSYSWICLLTHHETGFFA